MNESEFRAAGHRLVDRLADLLENIATEPLTRPAAPEFLHGLFDEPLPQEPSTLEAVFAELEEKLIPYCTQVGHPGYMGLITPSPLPAGILADFMASALNQNVGAWSIGPSATAMERRVVRWLGDLAGYGPHAGGLLTSGGMMANFIGLKLARDWASGDRAQHVGVEERFTAYTSDERHVSVDKAADAVGIGREGLRVIPSAADFTLPLDRLAAAIAEDRGRGCHPMAIVAMGGSTNTGAVDDLVALRALADRERMWLHVDAAYGGGMLLSKQNPSVLAGAERADSITIDPHKWFYAPLDAGALLVRDGARLTRSFGLQPAYLTDPLDPEGLRYNYYVHGFEQSRRFRGLKVWTSLKRYGARQLGAWVDANVEQARHLHALVANDPEFEAAVYPRMSALCIRFLRDDLSTEAMHDLHAQVARQIEAGGQFWISTTELKGATWFRINPVNFRTEIRHMKELLDNLRTACRRATGGPGGA